jgi:8-hydroxy-5-deazaflavin:NADPH oxidoreductase
MITTRRTTLKSLAIFTLLPSLAASAARAQQPVRIGVIGAGSLGGTVGALWVKAGHEVMFSSRHPDELKSMAERLGPRASVGSPAQAAAFGTVLLFAVPMAALPQLGRDLATQIKGKVVLDACNPPISGGGNDVDAEARRNGAAETTAKYLPGARIVRAFSAVDATVVDQSAAGGRSRVGMPMASDDAEAFQVAAGLVSEAGCDPVMVGGLAAARSFQQGNSGFRAHLPAPQLRELLGLPPA